MKSLREKEGDNQTETKEKTRAEKRLKQRDSEIHRQRQNLKVRQLQTAIKKADKEIDGKKIRKTNIEKEKRPLK